MAVPKKRKCTSDEYLSVNVSETDYCELINGRIVFLASPSVLHQRITGAVFAQIYSFIQSNGGKCEPFFAPLDVRIDDFNVVQPDVFIVCDDSKVDGKICNGVPDFIAEVTSSNYRHDYVDKLFLYKNAGVREYWIVDTNNKEILVYFFEKNDFPIIYYFGTSVPVNIYDGKLKIFIKE